MYRNLDPVALGITGRQSELIELALTYGFGGLDLDLPGIVKRARAGSTEQACRFIASAGIQGGEFDLPLDLAAPEMTFRSALVELGEFAEIAAGLKATGCRATVKPVTDTMPYQECFELHRSRLGEIAEVLAGHNIRLGLNFRAAASHRLDAETPFVHTGEALLTLLRTIGNPNVGVALDTWNWFVGGATLDQILELPVATIVSVAVADVAVGADLATITDEDRYMPGESNLVDCHAIVQHLKQADYTGPITLAPHPVRFAGMTRDAIVQQARATLNDLFNPAPPVEVSEAVEPVEVVSSPDSDAVAE